MQEIIIATNNNHKIEEFRQILTEYKVMSLKDVGLDNLEIIENGKTFAENAIIKSRTIADILNKVVIADDSGLEIDYLNKEPGIYSARYLGVNTPYDKKNNIILERMKDAIDRKARFICAISISYPNKVDKVFEGIFEGEIALEPKGENGFGYDPIFLVKELGKTSAELSPYDKNKISHRGKAMAKLLQWLEKEE